MATAEPIIMPGCQGEAIYGPYDDPDGDSDDGSGVPDHTGASVEQVFELFSATAPKGWRVELIGGEICVTSPVNGEHEEIVPDLVIAPKGSFSDREEWHDPSPVLLVAEVTSDSTAERDREQKIQGYARAGIPLYLLIDREVGEAVVHAEPSANEYAESSRCKLGLTVSLPAPLGFELDTAEF